VGEVWITVGWRKTTDKGNLVVATLEDPSRSVRFDLPAYNTTPVDQQVRVSDIGQGNVMINVDGAFLPGVLVRIGSRVLAPVVSSKSNSLSFAASAQELVRADGATLLSRGAEETPLLEKVTSGQLCASAATTLVPEATPLKIRARLVKITPYSDSLALVELPYDPPAGLLPSVVRR
jgi:hypothetical protein